jgi:hypothetical protein
VFGGRIVDRGHKGESGQLAYAWDRHQPTAGHRSPRHAPHVGVDRTDHRHLGSPRGDQTPHGGRETCDPFAGFDSLVGEGAVSARGSRIYGACKRGPAR